MIVLRSRLLTTSLATVCTLVLSCGGDSPARSTPPTTLAPTPGAPTPTPGGGGGVGASSCPLGVGSGTAECSRGTSRLLDQIEVAIDLTVRQKPEIFNLAEDAAPGSGQYKVLDVDAYLDAVVANLRAAGLCAQRDPDDATYERIQVKDSNDFSEDFDIIVSSGFIRRGDDAYRSTCTPSSFPIERGADEPPAGSGCGRPFPPPVTRFNCKVHLTGIEHYTLDSTPIVGPDCAYCAAAGFGDGRCLCAVRPHGAVDREACENWRVGTARDTGRPGPTWTKEDGTYCTGPDSGCENSPNQYQLWVYKGGRYKVEAGNGASCTVVVER